MNRLEEIKQRINAIKEELRSENADVDALQKEYEDLIAERSAILEANKKKEDLLNTIANGNAGTVIEQRTNVEEISLRDTKIAFAKRVLNKALNEKELRALGDAITTTATSYVGSSESQQGINNGGVFIPKSISDEILKEVELESAFLTDTNIMNVVGMIQFPYVITKDGAKTKAEGKDGENAGTEYGLLNLAVGNYTKTVAVTFELEALAPEEFTNYLIEELGIAIREAIASDVFYGTGSGDSMKGVTVGAISTGINQFDDLIDAMEKAADLLPKRKRAGAKYYLASDLYNKFCFAKDQNGAYLNNPTLALPKQFGKYPVVEDAMLKDGDFVLGAAKNAKLNNTKAITIYVDRIGKKRISEYTAHCMIAGAPVPNSFVHGKKRA